MLPLLIICNIIIEERRKRLIKIIILHNCIYQLFVDNYKRKKIINRIRIIFIKYFEFILIKRFLMLISNYLWA